MMKKITDGEFIKKVIVVIILMLIAIGMLLSCGPSRSQLEAERRAATKVVEIPARINIVEGRYGHHNYVILEVDGHEYLSNYEGGIIHLVSCTKPL